jgi:hypothetical protein
MMLKPLEKMYGYGAMAAAGMSSMAGMAGPYYGMHPNLTEAQFGPTAAGMHHHSMAAQTFGSTSFGAMVSSQPSDSK